MPECFNRVSISVPKSGFPLKTCGNDGLFALKPKVHGRKNLESIEV